MDFWQLQDDKRYGMGQLSKTLWVNPSTLYSQWLPRSVPEKYRVNTNKAGKAPKRRMRGVWIKLALWFSREQLWLE